MLTSTPRPTLHSSVCLVSHPRKKMHSFSMMRLGSTWLTKFSGLMFHRSGCSRSESPPALQSCTILKQGEKLLPLFLEKIVSGWYLLLSQSHLSPLSPMQVSSLHSQSICVYSPLPSASTSSDPVLDLESFKKGDHTPIQNPEQETERTVTAQHWDIRHLGI